MRRRALCLIPILFAVSCASGGTSEPQSTFTPPTPTVPDAYTPLTIGILNGATAPVKGTDA